MSILIKDMKMPKHCMDCVLKNDDDDCMAQKWKEWKDWEDMRKGCPLVELPKKHGRLIDQEEISKMIINPYEWREVMRWIIDAPTVIEAEGEG